MIKNILFLFIIISSIILFACYPKDYQGYYKIPQHHYTFFEAISDTIQLIDKDSNNIILSNHSKQIIVEEGSYDYPEHQVYWDSECYNSYYKGHNISFDLSIGYFGNPYVSQFTICYNFKFVDNDSSSFRYCFSDNDTLKFYNDSIIKLVDYKYEDDKLTNTSILYIQKSVGIISIKTDGDNIFYNADLPEEYYLKSDSY